MDKPQEVFQYKVLEPSDNYKDAVILKSGVTVTFTLSEVEQHQATLSKMKTELEGQITVDEATMQNVEHFHPIVSTLSDEDLAAIAIAFEVKQRLSKSKSKLAEVDKAIDDYKTETDTIMSELGFEAAVDPIAAPEVAPEVTPEAPVEAPAPETAPEVPTEAPAAPEVDPAADTPTENVAPTEGNTGN